MSTKPSALLTTLSSAGGWITLAIQVAGVLIPLGKALIGKIENISEGSATITFTDLVAADNAELDAIAALSAADLAAVNAELVRMGLPPLPTGTPPASSTPPAS